MFWRWSQFATTLSFSMHLTKHPFHLAAKQRKKGVSTITQKNLRPLPFYDWTRNSLHMQGMNNNALGSKQLELKIGF